MKMESQRDIGGALAAVDTNLSVALGSVCVAAREERSGLLDGQIEGGAGGKLADIHVATADAGSAGA